MHRSNIGQEREQRKPACDKPRERPPAKAHGYVPGPHPLEAFSLDRVDYIRREQDGSGAHAAASRRLPRIGIRVGWVNDLLIGGEIARYAPWVQESATNESYNPSPSLSRLAVLFSMPCLMHG